MNRVDPSLIDILFDYAKTYKGYQLDEFDGVLIKVAFRRLQDVAHQTARDKGWYDPAKTNMEALMLMVTELAEAAEELRNDNSLRPFGYAKDGKPVGLEIELADVVLRIADFAEFNKLSIGGAIVEKHLFNETRPRRHGNKRY